MTKAFWLAALERALKSAAQTLLLLWGADAGFDIIAVADWQEVAGLVGGAAALSLLTSLVSAGAGNSGPSLATERVEPTP